MADGREMLLDKPPPPASKPPSAAASAAAAAANEQALAASNRPPRLWLRRADQAVVALAIAMALATMTSYWYFRSGARELIEIDAAAPLNAEYVVDINRAGWPEFEPLPGVGEKLAKRIVASREADGPFASVDDLARVEGVHRSTIERLRPHLRAGAASRPPRSR